MAIAIAIGISEMAANKYGVAVNNFCNFLYVEKGREILFRRKCQSRVARCCTADYRRQTTSTRYAINGHSQGKGFQSANFSSLSEKHIT